jgi:hypothetical protein
MHHKFEILTSHWLIRLTNTSRKNDHKFIQQNKNYKSQKLYQWIHIQKKFLMVIILTYNWYFLQKLWSNSKLLSTTKFRPNKQEY